MDVSTSAVSAAEQPRPTILRSRYVQLRALLAIAITAVAGLTVALVLVATTNSSPRVRGAAVAAKSPTVRVNPMAESGAKLDHAGRFAARASVASGARIDHSGRLSAQQ